MSSFTLANAENFIIDHSMTLIVDSDEVNINYDLKDGDYSILLFNDHSAYVTVNENGRIENATVKINYLQLEQYDLKQNTNIHVGKGSSLSVSSTCLGTGHKQIVFDLYNDGSDSSIDISNNIVCLENADFSLECIGTIVKGARRSICHQSTHCLTMDPVNKARVLPVLKIDEDDVEASHSLASGTIDEEILFYMNSRGMNKKDALNLILRSYLMPGDDYYSSFDEGKAIQERAIRKVDEICSM